LNFFLELLYTSLHFWFKNSYGYILKHIAILSLLLNGQETFIRRISPMNANGNGSSNVRGEINPYYISRFTDAEGCFSILCSRNKKFEVGMKTTS